MIFFIVKDREKNKLWINYEIKIRLINSHFILILVIVIEITQVKSLIQRKINKNQLQIIKIINNKINQLLKNI